MPSFEALQPKGFRAHDLCCCRNRYEHPVRVYIYFNELSNERVCGSIVCILLVLYLSALHRLFVNRRFHGNGDAVVCLTHYESNNARSSTAASIDIWDICLWCSEWCLHSTRLVAGKWIFGAKRGPKLIPNVPTPIPEGQGVPHRKRLRRLILLHHSSCSWRR